MAILLGLGVGMLVGAWQGYWVAYVGIPAFIVTLAGMLLFRGLDLMMLNASSVAVPEGFQVIANGYIPEMGPVTGYHNPTLVLSLLLVGVVVVLELRKRADQAKHGMDRAAHGPERRQDGPRRRRLMVCGLLLASYKGVPVVGLILGGLVVAYSFLMRKTVFGRHIYSVGGNANAARPVRCGHQAGRLPRHGQHGRAGRGRGHGLHRLPQRRQPQGRRSASSSTPSPRSSSVARPWPAGSARCWVR